MSVLPFMPVERCPLHAAIWLPRFALQAVLRVMELPAKAAIVVLDSVMEQAGVRLEHTGRVLHANLAAERAGVVAGMTPAQAQARCAKLMLLPRSAAEESRVEQDLLECAAQWTPDYEASQPGHCVLDLTRLREPEQVKRSAGEEMRQWLAARGLGARVGFAPSPDLAGLAARAAERVLVLEGGAGGRELLRQLPVGALQPSAGLADLLRLWGVQTVAQLGALPREGVAARLGQEGLRLWQMAVGGSERLLRLVRTVEVFREQVELEHGIESVEPLLFVLGRLLDVLCLRLAENWLVAAAQSLELSFEDDTAHRCELRVAEPTRDAGLLLRVLQTHLEGLVASAPVKAVVLALVPVRPAARQALLFERSLRDPQRFAETLARFEALLGPGRAGRVRLLPSRRPDAFAVTGFLDPLPEVPAGSSVRLQGLPLRCFRPPREVGVKVQGRRPVGLQMDGGTLAVTQANGPWLLSGDWWDGGAWGREVWEIAVQGGALYQLAREGRCWVLDGIFG
jgi:protein ImuB